MEISFFLLKFFAKTPPPHLKGSKLLPQTVASLKIALASLEMVAASLTREWRH